MRGLGKRIAVPSSALQYSTFSAGGGGGRGRGRGFAPSPTPPPPPPSADDQDFPSAGHGRGRDAPTASSSGGPHRPILPSFVSSSSSIGRGRGLPTSGTPTPTTDPGAKKPIFFRTDKAQFADPDEPHGESHRQADPSYQQFVHLYPSPMPALPGAGRGKAPSAAADATEPSETNRHARPRRPIGAPGATSKPSVSPAAPVGPNLSQEEAVKKAVEVLSRGFTGGGDRGRGRGRGMFAPGRGRGRGKGRRDPDEDFELDVGDNADGEKFVKRMGEERMKIVEEAFEEMSSRVLPSPAEDAYLSALHTNNLIEYEPEYLMEFDRNPDIDDTPPMSLEEVLQKAKPFLMAYEGIKSQEEWEEIIKELMERLPHMKELIDMYCGPDRVTAKQQMQELERVAKTLPENIPSSVKRFTDRAVLSLQSNPGWGWDKKCQFMDKLVWEVSQHYK